MRKTAIIGIVLLVAIASVGSAMYLNYLPNPLVSNVAAKYPGGTLLADDVSFLLNIGIDENMVNMLNELNIEVYGIDNGCGSCIISWYENKSMEDGWTVVPEGTAGGSGLGWHFFVRGWRKGLMGQFIFVVEGGKVVKYIGYDMILITSTAPLSTYINFFR